MSESKQILEIYQSEIAKKTRVVRNRCGPLMFLDGWKGYRVFGLYNGLTLDDLELLGKTLENGKCPHNVEDQ